MPAIGPFSKRKKRCSLCPKWIDIYAKETQPLRDVDMNDWCIWYSWIICHILSKMLICLDLYSPLYATPCHVNLLLNEKVRVYKIHFVFVQCHIQIHHRSTCTINSSRDFTVPINFLQLFEFECFCIFRILWCLSTQ